MWLAFKRWHCNGKSHIISIYIIIRLMNLYQFTLLSRGIRMGFCCRALDCRDRLIFEATTGADSASKLGHAALFSRCPLWIFIWSIWPAKLIVIWICWIVLNPWSLGLAKSCPAEGFESTWQINFSEKTTISTIMSCVTSIFPRGPQVSWRWRMRQTSTPRWRRVPSRHRSLRRLRRLRGDPMAEVVETTNRFHGLFNGT